MIPFKALTWTLWGLLEIAFISAYDVAFFCQLRKYRYLASWERRSGFKASDSLNFSSSLDKTNFGVPFLEGLLLWLRACTSAFAFSTSWSNFLTSFWILACMFANERSWERGLGFGSYCESFDSSRPCWDRFVDCLCCSDVIEYPHGLWVFYLEIYLSRRMPNLSRRMPNR